MTAAAAEATTTEAAAAAAAKAAAAADGRRVIRIAFSVGDVGADNTGTERRSRGRSVARSAKETIERC